MFRAAAKLSLIPIFLSASCAHTATEVTAEPTAAIPAAVIADATAGVENPRFRELLAREWDRFLHEAPVMATQLSDHRFDDRLGDPSYQHLAVRRQLSHHALEEARALRKEHLSPRDRTLLETLIDEAETDEAQAVCKLELWNVGAGNSDIFEDLAAIPQIQVVTTVADGKNLVARYRAIPAYLDAESANLKAGAKLGRFATATMVQAEIDEINLRLAQPLAEWELSDPARKTHADWASEDLTAFQTDLTAAVAAIPAALTRYRDTLAHDVLPHARDEAHAGLSNMPSGAECYRAMIRGATSLSQSPEELHQLGLAQVAAAEVELADLGAKLFGTRDLHAILERLRSDRSLYFTTSQEIATNAEQAIARVRAKLPQYFGVLPKAELTVRAMDPAQAATHGTPFYEAANLDGSKPGAYRINLSKPETRSRWDAENSAFHEGLPGHHLQISIAQELHGVPAFLKYNGPSAFYEGWALYAERLADEMGAYSGDIDRLGMIGWDLVRGARLVVDTGLHAKGMTREEGRKYFHDHTGLTESDIALEVDRYVTWPAQALAYKVGDLTIRRLRKQAEKELGPKFDLRAFHDTVLGSGAVTLHVLELQINEWIAKTKLKS